MIQYKISERSAFRITVGFVALTIMLFVGGVGATPSTGKWQGLTSQGEEVSFIVNNNKVNIFNITFICGWGRVGYSTALNTPIVSDKFQNPGYYFSYEGTFTSPTTATGTSNISEWNPPWQQCTQSVNWDTTLSSAQGDVDGDNQITASDALLYLRYAVGQNTAPFMVDISDDVTCDGNIYADDALLVLRKAVGQNVILQC